MKVKRTHGLGNHLLVDAEGCDEKALDDEAAVKAFLEALPKLVGATQIHDTVIKRHVAKDPDESGVTGFILLAESHASVHTFPAKGFFHFDLFTHDEFDHEAVMDEVHRAFSPSKVSKKLVRRSHTDVLPLDGLQRVSGDGIFGERNAASLVRRMETVGFQATQLARAARLMERMRNDKATVFFAFTSNLVSSGLREVIAEVVRRRLVDIVITSAGAIEEDFMKAFKPFLLGDFDVSDSDLRKAGINRIGNVFVPNDRYETLEEKIKPILEAAHKQQQSIPLSPSRLAKLMGESLRDEKSFLYWAAKNGVPVFCPAITDGALGLQLYFYKKDHKDFVLDVTADMDDLAQRVFAAKKAGALILGGGVAKHHTLGINLMRDGLDYAVYVCTGTEYDGSLSGARPKEAKSWGKLREDANHAYVECDATIALPLLVKFME